MADAYQHTGQYNQAFVLLNKITLAGNSRIDDALVQMGSPKKMGVDSREALKMLLNTIPIVNM